MGNKQEYIRKALDIVANRKAHERALADQRKQTLLQKSPEFAAIENKIRQNGIQAVQKALSFNNSTAALQKLQDKNNLLVQKQADVLRKNGLPPEYLDLHIHCSLCEDSGYCHGRICECVKTIAQGIAIDKLNECSPLALSSFESFSLDFYPNTKDTNGVIPRERMSSLVSFCRNYAQKFTLSSENLLFLGATGLGKTHLSLAIAKIVIEQGYGVLYGSTQDFLHQIENEHFGRSQGDTLETLLDCDLLILDDLGSEFSSAFVTSVIYNLVNSRILTKHPTIINTNLTIAELESHYTARVISRLVGHYTIKQFLGHDIRVLKVKNRNST